MRPALLLISLSLAAFLTADVLVQEPVESQFQTDLVLVDPVAGVSLFVPSVAVEGTNVSLRCTWTAGTDISVQWGKDDSAIIADSRITILEGLLVISPARRSDTGRYTCTVSNPVSAETASESLRIYYGPDTPVITKDTPKECVGGGDARVGQTVRLNCMADSLPPALFSWQGNGVPLPSDQPDSGVLSLETVSTSESGEYICTARNIITGGVSDQRTDLAIVDTCLDVGEVVGIVIGCLLLLIIIVLLILLIVCLVQRRRRVTERQRGRDGVVVVQKTNPNPRPLPPVPQTNGARDLGQGPPPPPLLKHTRART
ncbi:HEPACAM family member 2 [Aulostomus maculatus]